MGTEQLILSASELRARARSEKDIATKTLQHYILHLRGFRNPDCYAEVGDIATHIVNAAVAEIEAKMLEQQQKEEGSRSEPSNLEW